MANATNPTGSPSNSTSRRARVGRATTPVRPAVVQPGRRRKEAVASRMRPPTAPEAPRQCPAWLRRRDWYAFPTDATRRRLCEPGRLSPSWSVLPVVLDRGDSTPLSARETVAPSAGRLASARSGRGPHIMQPGRSGVRSQPGRLVPAEKQPLQTHPDRSPTAALEHRHCRSVIVVCAPQEGHRSTFPQ